MGWGLRLKKRGARSIPIESTAKRDCEGVGYIVLDAAYFGEPVISAHQRRRRWEENVQTLFWALAVFAYLYGQYRRASGLRVKPRRPS